MKKNKLGLIIIKMDIKIDTDQIVEIGECYIVVKPSMEKYIEKGCSMIKIIEVT